MKGGGALVVVLAVLSVSLPLAVADNWGTVSSCGTLNFEFGISSSNSAPKWSLYHGKGKGKLVAESTSEGVGLLCDGKFLTPSDGLSLVGYAGSNNHTTWTYSAACGSHTDFFTVSAILQQLTCQIIFEQKFGASSWTGKSSRATAARHTVSINSRSSSKSAHKCPNVVNGTQPLMSAWPLMNPQTGWLSGASMYMHGMWDLFGVRDNGVEGVSGGRDGDVPLVLLAPTEHAAPGTCHPTDAVPLQRGVVFAPASNFMLGWIGNLGADVQGLAGGLASSLLEVPAKTVHTTAFTFHPDTIPCNGVSALLKEWGQTLLGTTSKAAPGLTLQKIGYWTDNGAFYYYNTMPETTYEGTMTMVAGSPLPYAYMQYDSWWYYKGPNGGLKEWTARPDVFPDGMATTNNKTGLPVALHNRWFSKETVYAKKFKFVIEEWGSLPVDPTFWAWLFSEGIKGWKLDVYEQDWLIDQFSCMYATQQQLGVAEEWLTQMHDAAKANNLHIQYCMPLPMFYLQSTKYSHVTQIRASNDYFVRNQWMIGRTSMLAHALGLAPFKDTFWSSTTQTGSTHYNLTEYNPELQTIVALLSTGPVGPGDKLGFENSHLLRRTIMGDGTLLKPQFPAVPLERTMLADKSSRIGGELYWTMMTNPAKAPPVALVFAANLTKDVAVSASDLRGAWGNWADAPVSNAPISWLEIVSSEKNTVLTYRVASPNGTLVIPACPAKGLVNPHHLYVAVPSPAGGGVAIVGDMGKYSPQAPQMWVTTKNSFAPREAMASLLHYGPYDLKFGYLKGAALMTLQCTVKSMSFKVVCDNDSCKCGTTE